MSGENVNYQGLTPIFRGKDLTALATLEEARDAGYRAAGPDAGNKHVNLAVCCIPAEKIREKIRVNP